MKPIARKYRGMALLFAFAFAALPLSAQTTLFVRSGLIPAGPEEHARLSVINTAATSSATVRVILRILVWDEISVRGIVSHSLRNTLASDVVTLVPGQGASLDYANETCDKVGECNSISAIVEFPDGLDLAAKPSFQLIDARKGRVLLTVLHDASGP